MGDIKNLANKLTATTADEDSENRLIASGQWVSSAGEPEPTPPGGDG